MDYEPSPRPSRDIVALARACAGQDPSLLDLAEEVGELVEDLIPEQSVGRLVTASRVSTLRHWLRSTYDSGYDFHLHWWLRLVGWAIPAVLLGLWTPAAALLAPVPLEAFLLGATWRRRRRLRHRLLRGTSRIGPRRRR
jgi:hypothetical protein